MEKAAVDDKHPIGRDFALFYDERYIVQKIEDNYYNKRKSGLSSIIENLKTQQRHLQVDDPHQLEEAFDKYSGGGEPSPVETLDPVPGPLPPSKLSRKRRRDHGAASDYTAVNNNNNNHVKNERLSPGTTDVSSQSRSATPSSVTHPDTPPATETHPLISGRNYSDFMRSLAAKYNNANPNDYFSAARNGFPPPVDPRFKPSSSASPSFPLLNSKDITGGSSSNAETAGANKKSDFSTSILNPFATPGIFPSLVDMSSTQTLLAMVRAAKESDFQQLLKTVKRHDASSPLDLSAASVPTVPPSMKRPRGKASMSSSSHHVSANNKRADSESPRLHEDVAHWTVEDVSNFVSNIDICAEYAKNFREQRIDGAGLPLLTEEHLTSTMNMKLGPALKLRSILAKKLGSCGVCLHCTHCHNSSGSPEPATTAGNTSDSGGAS